MAVPSLTSPSDQYKRRLGLHEQQVQALEARHVGFGYLRLLLVLAIVAMAWASFVRDAFSPLLLVIPLLGFVVTAVIHSRVLRQQARASRAAEVYRKGLARMEDQWPRTTERSLPEELIATSLYARDLDIVGKGSLFELLCLARTRMGELCLLQWLLAPAPLAKIYQRQQAVTELRDKLDFRERVAVSGGEAQAGACAESLRQWAMSPAGSLQGWARWGALVLAALGLCALAAWLTDGPRLPLLSVVLVELCLARYLKAKMAAVMQGTENSLKTLTLFSALMGEFEREEFHTERLSELRRDLLSHANSASAAVEALGKIVSYTNTLSNPLLRPFDLLLMYSVQLAFAVQRWRTMHGSAVPAWLDAVGEMEALLSLAAYSYEHPDDPFPTFVDGAASLNVQAVGHPLIPAASCVRNSVTIGGTHRVLLISGSNMSGKSTLMRTVGVNVVLAMCGAPVRARHMELTPLAVGASLVVNDSLLRGKSRFYAEIEKIQAICELARTSELPVLFLLDELLQGTNSNDRLIGAAGVTRELVERGAIGMLTTHDLSLTAIENGEGWIRNAHFQDFIVDGKMQFDFHLRDGVVTKSNGVELMRLIGLKV